MKNQLLRLAKPIVERFPKLAMTYRYMRDSWQVYEVPQDTPLGFKFIGNPLMQSGQFEPAETRMVKSIVSHVDVVINVGANIGYYCLIALRQSKHVVAFEPINLNLRYLLRNIKANAWDSQIEVFPLAISNQVGVIEIYGGGTGASLVKGWAGNPEHHVALVPCSTLDIVLGSRFDGRQCFVLVDIEGAEKLMLDGASIMLDMMPRPIWLVEIAISDHQPKGTRINPNLQSTFQVFWDRGYEAWTADENSRIVHPKDIEEIVTQGKDTLGIHNFLFVEAGKKASFIGEQS